MLVVVSWAQRNVKLLRAPWGPARAPAKLITSPFSLPHHAHTHPARAHGTEPHRRSTGPHTTPTALLAAETTPIPDPTEHQLDQASIDECMQRCASSGNCTGIEHARLAAVADNADSADSADSCEVVTGRILGAVAGSGAPGIECYRYRRSRANGSLSAVGAGACRREELFGPGGMGPDNSTNGTGGGETTTPAASGSGGGITDAAIFGISFSVLFLTAFLTLLAQCFKQAHDDLEAKRRLRDEILGEHGDSKDPTGRTDNGTDGTDGTGEGNCKDPLNVSSVSAPPSHWETRAPILGAGLDDVDIDADQGDGYAMYAS